jgi:hypothetical protein
MIPAMERNPVLPSMTAWVAAFQQLRTQHYADIPAKVMATCACISPADWKDFAEHWSRLTLDRYMADSGTYRLRRYGQFNTLPGGSLEQLPHGPYEQPRCINPLNGGVKRFFDPLEESFAQHPVLHGLLHVLREGANYAEGAETPWNIRLHPYRILARDETPGLPTPEGLHRDGVHYIVSLLVRRSNVLGGESQVTDADGRLLYASTLLEPIQTLIANDERTMHSVSALHPLIKGEPAFRDVLVVALTKQEAT